MDDSYSLFLKALAQAIGTVGPVGLFCLGAWYLWLRSGRPGLAKKLEDGNKENHKANQEVRDMTRDILASVTRTEVAVTHSIAEIAGEQRKIADTLERVSYRLGLERPRGPRGSDAG